MGFLFAPKLHPAFKAAAGVRRELGVRTMLSTSWVRSRTPLARATRSWASMPPATWPTLGRVLATLGAVHAFVVHGGGYDEITVTGSTLVAEVRAAGRGRDLRGSPPKSSASAAGSGPRSSRAATPAITRASCATVLSGRTGRLPVDAVLAQRRGRARRGRRRARVLARGGVQAPRRRPSTAARRRASFAELAGRVSSRPRHERARGHPRAAEGGSRVADAAGTSRPERELVAALAGARRPQGFLRHPRVGRRGGPLRVIAEVKRASPSAGAESPRGLTPPAQPERYRRGRGRGHCRCSPTVRASAGSLADLFTAVRGAVGGARSLCARTSSSIATSSSRRAWPGPTRCCSSSRPLAPDASSRRAPSVSSRRARRWAVLVEVHDEPRARGTAVRAGARLIGINNRNLDTFTVDLATSERLLRRGSRPA